ncbi:MAG: hypothetical protein WBB29_18010 [Geitlerinemataceae cyanobacterium]
MNTSQGIPALSEFVVKECKEEQLQHMNPKVVAAIRAIQAEKMGKELINWSDFSSHTQN